jgi:hypothetical protein
MAENCVTFGHFRCASRYVRYKEIGKHIKILNVKDVRIFYKCRQDKSRKKVNINTYKIYYFYYIMITSLYRKAWTGSRL